MDPAALTPEVHISRSVDETISLGEHFAAQMMHPGSIVALRGELASGKTHFTKGIAKHFGIDDHDISSPTFALANEFEAQYSGTVIPLYHLDCYRFEKPEELLELGVEDYLYPDQGMCVIEWAERIEEYLPEQRIDILFETTSQTERRITIISHEQ